MERKKNKGKDCDIGGINIFMEGNKFSSKKREIECGVMETKVRECLHEAGARNVK